MDDTVNKDAFKTEGSQGDPDKNFLVVGLGASELDDYAKVAAQEQGGRVLNPDAEPEKGFYYRSDHFNFAKLGVPALTVDEGVDYVGKPAAFSEQVRAKWTADVYHKPSDEVTAAWDLSGLAEDVQLLFAVGYRVAEADRYPAWSPGNEFKAIRDAQLKGK